MTRAPLEESDILQEFFTTTFATDINNNIGYLSWYTFVPCKPIWQCSKQHLQSLLQLKKALHNNVQAFVVFGLQNLDKPRSLLKSTQMPDDTTQMTDDPPQHPPNQDSTIEQMSIRYYLY